MLYGLGERFAFAVRFHVSHDNPMTLTLRALAFATLLVHCASAQKVTLDRSFGADLQDMQMTADDVSEIVRQRFGAQSPSSLPIYCHFAPWLKNPITKLEHPGQIDIYLNVDERRWTQFAFQLAHELGHVMTGSQRTNGIIETICCALSYEVLDVLSEKWASGAPFINRGRFFTYAANFRKYREDDQHAQIATLPEEIRTAVAESRWLELSQYLHAHESEREEISPAGVKSKKSVTIQTLGAIALRSGAIPWKNFLGLANCTAPSPKQKPEFLVAPIRAECLVRLSGTLCRIGVACHGNKRSR